MGGKRGERVGGEDGLAPGKQVTTGIFSLFFCAVITRDMCHDDHHRSLHVAM